MDFKYIYIYNIVIVHKLKNPYSKKSCFPHSIDDRLVERESRSIERLAREQKEILGIENKNEL